MVKLFLGDKSFDLSGEENAETLERRITSAFTDGKTIEVDVVVDRADVSLTVNPRVVPYWYVLDEPRATAIRVR